MDKFILSLDVLKNIISKRTTFAVALKNVFSSNFLEKQDRIDISALTGCVLRHYLVFNYFYEKNISTDGDVDEKHAVFCLIANELYLKRFSKTEMVSAFKNVIKNNKSISQILNHALSEHLIPDDLDKKSTLYLSLRYNTPEWIVAMWQKYYGILLTITILKSNNKTSHLTVCPNELLKDKTQILAEHAKIKSSPVDGIYIFEEKFNFKAIQNDDLTLFPIKMATKLLLDKLDIDPFKGTAIFSAIQNNMSLYLYSKFGRDILLENLTNNHQHYLKEMRYAKKIQCSNTEIFEIPHNQIITCLSKKVSTFIVLPKSSMFDLLRTTPDYFLRTNREDLDFIIKEQFETLSEASEQVEEGGNLVYMVPTLSKKESMVVINDFLSSHTDFVLKEEKQFFPFEEYESCLYYAILHKKDLL